MIDSGQLRLDLRQLIHGSITIVGVGNELRGDDALGSCVIKQLDSNVHASCIDAGMAPENVLEKIAATRPDTILFVDAVNSGSEPGSIRMFSPEELAGGTLATHGLSLALSFEYLSQRTNASIFLIGIQPVSIGFGEEMSTEIQSSIAILVEVLKEIFPHA